MAQAMAAIVNKVAWVDLSSADAGASRTFYATVFGWQVEVDPDPQYGGYALAKLDGKDVGGIGPTMSPGAPTAWNIYIGTENIDDLAGRSRPPAGRSSRRRSMSAIKGEWRSFRIPPARSSRPGRGRAWAGSRRMSATRTAGPS